MRWSDPPGRTYAPHRHDHHESLWCVSGSIVLQIDGADYPLGPGDRLMLPRGTQHAAEAGAGGATYLIGEKD
jgi:quercetin dioxygenase-like cupin family protein